MIIKTTCPRDCYDTCGIEVEIESDKVIRVTGDKDHPYTRGSLCGKCELAYNGVFLDPKVRLSNPLRRLGIKGEGRFVEVSWDEALQSISAKLEKIASNDPSKILHAHYTGTCSLIANKFPMRFFNRLGATEVDPDTVCNMAGHVALEQLIGTSLIGFDPRTAKDSESIFVWGANPSATAPHAHKYWLKEAGAKIVVIDPVRHQTAVKAALHLQLRPGSDAALAFSLMHVLMEEDALDKGFIEKYTIGWEELKPQVQKCTPSWGERQTGLNKNDIIKAAKIYADGPALLWLGQGLQRQKYGGNIIRSCAVLPAITGNFSKPGSGLLYLNGSGRKGVDNNYLTGSSLGKPQPAISHMDLAKKLENTKESSAFICWNINPAVSNPEQQRLRQALARDDLFTVVVDIFETDTTDYADYVLPAASFLEFDDLVSGYFNLSFSAQARVKNPHGDSLPNQEIFRRLAQYMNFNESELYETDREIIEKTLNDVGLKGGFNKLKSVGTTWPTDEVQIQFPEKIFPTNSGKIEISSFAAEAQGMPRLPKPIVDFSPKSGKFRLISPASRWLMNGSYANDKRIMKKLGSPTIFINPIDAKKIDVSDGELVSVSNEVGTIELITEVSDIVSPGVAMSYKGRWPRQETEVIKRNNVNFLHSGIRTDMGSSNAVHNIEVTIKPI